jgi:hypothetical protein
MCLKSLLNADGSASFYLLLHHVAASAFGRSSRPMAGEDIEAGQGAICQKFYGLLFIENQDQNEMIV